MTADIELLPLSEYLYGREARDNERVVTVADAHAYAIRNVAHHTAAKDAEIEALRAQLIRVTNPDGSPNLHAEQSGAAESYRVAAIYATQKREEAEAQAERLAEEIDWIKSQPEDDRMFAEIEAAAKASFHRHRTSCRGQALTRADNYESHLVWATLEWAKRTNGAEQHAERLAEALRRAEGLLRSAGIIAESDLERPHSIATEIKNALRDHDKEGKDG